VSAAVGMSIFFVSPFSSAIDAVVLSFMILALLTLRTARGTVTFSAEHPSVVHTSSFTRREAPELPLS
jgi:hypothetical protein